MCCAGRARARAGGQSPCSPAIAGKRAEARSIRENHGELEGEHATRVTGSARGGPVRESPADRKYRRARPSGHRLSVIGACSRGPRHESPRHCLRIRGREGIPVVRPPDEEKLSVLRPRCRSARIDATGYRSRTCCSLGARAARESHVSPRKITAGERKGGDPYPVRRSCTREEGGRERKQEQEQEQEEHARAAAAAAAAADAHVRRGAARGG